MFLLFYLIFSVNGKKILKSRYDISHLDLSKINDNDIFLDPDNKLDLESKYGICQIDFNEVPIETIYDIHFKNKLLNILLDKDVSIFQKIELIQQNDYIFNKKDDILDDWNNIF